MLFMCSHNARADGCVNCTDSSGLKTYRATILWLVSEGEGEFFCVTGADLAGALRLAAGLLAGFFHLMATAVKSCSVTGAV